MQLSRRGFLQVLLSAVPLAYVPELKAFDSPKPVSTPLSVSPLVSRLTAANILEGQYFIEFEDCCIQIADISAMPKPVDDSWDAFRPVPTYSITKLTQEINFTLEDDCSNQSYVYLCSWFNQLADSISLNSKIEFQDIKRDAIIGYKADGSIHRVAKLFNCFPKNLDTVLTSSSIGSSIYTTLAFDYMEVFEGCLSEYQTLKI